MQDYVKEAINAAKSKGGVIGASLLKEVVAISLGREITAWRIDDAPIKDEPVSETGKAFVPIGRLWWYDPPIGGLMLWVTATLKRHDREVIRLCEALQLPQYRRKAEAKNALPRLRELRDLIAKTIEAIED